MHLPYLAAQQAVNRLSNEQFELERHFESETESASRMDTLRAGVAELLRRTADRVEPVGVRS